MVLGVFGEADLPALGLRVFPAYVRLVRKLQRTYFLGAQLQLLWTLPRPTLCQQAL